MKLHQIQYILEVAKVKSINQAAKNLYVSQPYLSASIADLEKDLNITIFKRTAKGVELTTVGEEFVKACQYVDDQVNYMKNLHTFHEFREQASLMIVSNCHNDIANDILIQLQRENGEKATRFYFKTDNALAIIKSLCNITLNLGLLVVPAIEIAALNGLFKTKKIVFNTILEENPYAMVGKNCPLYYEKQATLDQCRHYPLVAFIDDWERTFNEFQLHNFQHIFTVNDKKSLFHTIATTDTIALGSRAVNSNSHYATSGLIRFIPLESETFNNYIIGWVQRKNSSLTPLEEEFIYRYDKYVKEAYESLK